MSCLPIAFPHARWESMWSSTKSELEENAQHHVVGFRWLYLECRWTSWCHSVLRSWPFLLLQTVLNLQIRLFN